MHRDQIIANKVQQRTARPTVNLTGLAHSVGIPRSTLRRRLANGGWKYDELEHLAKALDMTVDQLIHDTPDTNGPHSRACGPRAHPHGTECHPNCPTCNGVDFPAAPH